MRDVMVDREVLEDAVTLACRAPSLHNSQPWRWVGNGPVVYLFLDTGRAPKHTDTSGGLATCTLSHLTEVPASRQVVATLVGGRATPQVLVRVGSSPAPEEIGPPRPRRAVEDVLEFHDT